MFINQHCQSNDDHTVSSLVVHNKKLNLLSICEMAFYKMFYRSIEISRSNDLKLVRQSIILFLGTFARHSFFLKPAHAIQIYFTGDRE